MGKPHSQCYYFAGYGGQAGTMICKSCNKPIYNFSQDWMSQVRHYKWDWEYEVFHRACVQDDSPWEKLEAAAAEKAQKTAATLNALHTLAKKLNIDDPIVFARFAAESLGEDLDQYYFYLYGSN